MNIMRSLRDSVLKVLGMSASNPERWMPSGGTGFYSVDTETGLEITADSSMTSSAVYGCVRVLSETVAQLPLILYSRIGEGKRRYTESRLYSILHDKPNRWQTRFEWVEMGMGHLLLRGNFYNRIVYGQGGEIVELVPLHPDSTWPQMIEGDLWYWHRDQSGQDEAIPAREMFHIRGMSSDGITGITPLQYAKNSVALAIAMETHGARLFKNGAQLRMVLKHPGEMGKEALERFRVQWQELYGGVYNSGKTAILEEGMTVERLGMSSEDAQFVESRKFQLNDIARFFNVPLHLIQDYERATFSNVEHLAISFVQHTITPWLVRWEQAVNSRLIPLSVDDPDVFSEFLVEALLRGDTATRYSAYQTAILSGWMHRNEVRIKENLNPAPGLDEFLVPLNMASQGADGTASDPEDETLMAWVYDASERVIRAEDREPGREWEKRQEQIARTFQPILGSRAVELAGIYRGMVESGEANSSEERTSVLVSHCLELRKWKN